MKALVAARYGGPEVLELRDVDPPRPDEGRALIEVRSAGINFSDLLTFSGTYPGPAPPFVPGIEIAGVETDSGRPVMALIERGGYAAIASSTREMVFDASGLDLERAGGYALTTLACYFGLTRAARLEAGETVLVLAAAGALGSTAVQVARTLGAGRVYGVASTEEKRSVVRKIGADDAFAYTEELPPADVVVDGVGGDAFLNAYRSTCRFGRALLVGASSGSPPPIPSFQELRERSVALVPFSFKALRTASPELVARDAPGVVDLLRRGEIVPVIADRLPFEDAVSGLRRLLDRQTVGKLLLHP